MTTFRSTSLLAKRYEWVNGEAQKTTAAQMTSGDYYVREFADVEGLKDLLGSLTTHEAACASLPTDGSESGRIVCQSALAAHPGAKARTRSHFAMQACRGLGFLDHDCGSDENALTRDDLWQGLLRVAPGFAEAGVLWRPSGSSHIFHGEHDLTGLRGQHMFVCVEDASDWSRCIKVIAKRFWLLGLGRVDLSSSGSLLLRGPIDTAPADAARLIFAAGSECAPPLEQRRGPGVILSSGGFLDTRRLIADLSADEELRYETLVEQAKAARYAEAMSLRAAHRGATISRRLPDMMKAGVSAADAEARIGAAVDAVYRHTLLGDAEC